jgi:hypothetical protein
VAVDRLSLTSRSATRLGNVAADRFYVFTAIGAIVCSGTWLATPVILVVGLVGLALLISGRPISTGWALLALPPIGYVLLGIANGQLGSLHDISEAIPTDFRVIALIPILVFMATQRHSPVQAAHTLRAVVTGVTGGLALALGVSVLTGAHGNLPFSSHHAVGFAAAVNLIAVVALPRHLVPHRGVIIAISAFSLVASGSRSGLVAAIAGLLTIPVVRLLSGQRSGWTVGKVLRFVLLSLLVAGAATIVAPQSVERMTSTISSVVDSGLNAATFGGVSSGSGVSVADRNVAVRLSVWERLSPDAGLSAILRVDTGTVDDVLSDTPEDQVTHRVFSAHNFYLQLVVEIGWLGMLAYIGLSSAGIRLLARGRSIDARAAIIGVWIAVLAFGLTSNSLISPAVMVPAAFYLHLLESDPQRRRRAPA